MGSAGLGVLGARPSQWGPNLLSNRLTVSVPHLHDHP